MSHNVDSMAYYGDPPWHGLGVRVPCRAKSVEMIGAAGLDWRVEKVPVPGARPGSDGEPTRYQLMRKARAGTLEQDVLLGLVSRRYQPLQNSEAFAFFDAIVGKGQAIFETAGALGDGERVWVLAKMPGPIRVAGDDIVEKYLLLSNTHNGKESVTVKFTPIRVVCQNTLVLALEHGSKAARVRHTVSIHERLDRVPELLGMFHSVFRSAEESFNALARCPCEGERLVTYLSRLMPRTEKQQRSRSWPDKWIQVAGEYEAIGKRVPQVRGTLWAAYNAVTYYEDYRAAREAGPDRRLNRVWYGSGADLKLRALIEAEQIAQELGSTRR